MLPEITSLNSTLKLHQDILQIRFFQANILSEKIGIVNPCYWINLKNDWKNHVRVSEQETTLAEERTNCKRDFMSIPPLLFWSQKWPRMTLKIFFKLRIQNFHRVRENLKKSKSFYNWLIIYWKHYMKGKVVIKIFNTCRIVLVSRKWEMSHDKSFIDIHLTTELK